MGALRSFEIEVVRRLAGATLSPELLEKLIGSEGPARYEYRGSGYFLTISHPDLPQNRTVCAQPAILGRSGEVVCGFVLFIESGELTLECHTWGSVDVPEGFRDVAVAIEAAA